MAFWRLICRSWPRNRAPEGSSSCDHLVVAEGLQLLRGVAGSAEDLVGRRLGPVRDLDGLALAGLAGEDRADLAERALGRVRRLDDGAAGGELLVHGRLGD